MAGMVSSQLLTGKSLPLPLKLSSFNHFSRNCENVELSVRFYEDVLGFVRIKRPDESIGCDGAWLYNFSIGIGVHLLMFQEGMQRRRKGGNINPREDHISFQCDDVRAVEQRLNELGVRCVRQVVKDGDIFVEQLFFHDPDGHMIEICNCEAFPVVPLAASKYNQQVPGCCGGSGKGKQHMEQSWEFVRGAKMASDSMDQSWEHSRTGIVSLGGEDYAACA